jgi:hypothetical protein
MSEHSGDLELVAQLDESARLSADTSGVWSSLFDLAAIDRIKRIDELTEQHRQAMAVLARLRDEAVRDLAGTMSVARAAEALGVTRQAVYKSLQEHRRDTNAEFTNFVFVNERIELDGKTFRGCTFEGCILVYTAKAPFGIIDSALNDCEWSFEGSAALTLDLLAALYRNADDLSRAVAKETLRRITDTDLMRGGGSMSTGQTQRTIEQLQREIARFQEKISKETKSQVSLSERLGRVRQQQAQSRSAATIRSKEHEAGRFERDILASQRRRADFESQVARKTAELHRYQNKLVKEQASEQSRMLKRLETENRAREHAALSGIHTARPYIPAVAVQHTTTESVDVFISHATEDKEEVARPLAEALRELGLRVWYDELELKIGDSLRRKIDSGLARSRFGIVILSPSFFEKNWPQYELDGLVAKEQQHGQKVILPLWHKLSKDEVMRFSPTLADRIALSTSQYTTIELAKKLHEAM